MRIGRGPLNFVADALLIDCHSDMMVDVRRRRRAGESAVLRRRHLPRLSQGGVHAAVCVVGGDVPVLSSKGEPPYQAALDLIEMLREDVAESEGLVDLGDSAHTIRTKTQAGAFVAIPSFEGASPLDRELDRVEEFYEAGVRAIGLTWNSRNAFAVGVGIEPGSGLTALGKRAVREMNDVGMLVDVAHLSPRGFWDVVSATRSPIIASHANARGKWNHERNLDDDQLAALRELGGLVGVVLYPLFLGPQPLGIDDVVEHVLYLSDRLGPEGVGIGADFIDYALEETVSDPFGPGDPESLTYPRGLEDCRSLNSLLPALSRAGFSDDEVAGIAGQNFLRVLDQVQVARNR